ncbi:hypothetical protein pah_c180o063 [Parachlamydia acanthamoebae str. Hall's coccus]|nr:hypothetical protein pah_c180o063 [Parachlamydia acanthamoebae str. Hall's coccus]
MHFLLTRPLPWKKQITICNVLIKKLESKHAKACLTLILFFDEPICKHWASRYFEIAVTGGVDILFL